jgi:hypothetical protein
MSGPVGDAVVMEEPEASDTERPHARDGLLADAAWVLGTSVVLGLLGGVLWWLLVDPALFTKAPNDGLAMGEAQLGKRFAADGWFVVIAAVFGLLSGSALTWWRSRDFLATSVLLVVGSVIGTALMVLVGRLLGPPDPESLAASAAVGDRLPMQLEVTATVAYLVWPIAVLVGALFVLWSPPTEPVR